MGNTIFVIGAGLSGLAAALGLEKRGAKVVLIEKNDSVGGRIRTDRVDGFLFDHGFQVLLPSYERVQELAPVENLHPHYFRAGAVIHKNRESVTMANPMKEPTKALSTLMSPLFTLKEKALTSKLQFELHSFAYGKSKQLGKTTKQWLEEQGYSASAIENFFSPFFSGVFLETQLDTPSSFFQYLFGRFSSCHACLPDQGMQALPEYLRNQLKSTEVRLRTEFVAAEGKTIRLRSEEMTYEEQPDAVIFALDPWSLGSTKARSVTTNYYVSEENPGLGDWLHLNANISRRWVNHVASLTEVNPNYSPKGRYLLSVNCLEPGEVPLDQQREELHTLFGEKAKKWKFLRSYSIAHALPVLGESFQAKLNFSSPHLFAGDYCETPSIQGALESGLNAAKSLPSL